MKRNAAQSNDGITSTGSSTKAHGAQTIGVRDSRNRRVPGLYVRNGRYYAQLWVKRRAPDCSWHFPSPQRGPRDAPARTFQQSLLLTRKAARLAWVGFHDLRHSLPHSASWRGWTI